MNLDLTLRLFTYFTGQEHSRPILIEMEYFLQRLEELIDYTFLDEADLAVLEEARDSGTYGIEFTAVSKRFFAYLTDLRYIYIDGVELAYLFTRLTEFIDYFFGYLTEEGLDVLEAVRDDRPLPLVKVPEVV